MGLQPPEDAGFSDRFALKGDLNEKHEEVDEFLLPIQIPTISYQFPTPFSSNPFFCEKLDWLRIHLSTNLLGSNHPECETIWVESLWC